MADPTIFQTSFFAKFVLPFALIFFIVFAVLEKTGVFGESKRQLNALIAFVIGLIFIGVSAPRLLVEDLILFLTISLVVVLVGVLLYAFASGESAVVPGKPGKIVLGIVIIIGLVITIIVSTGFSTSLVDFFRGQNYGSAFWTNLFFIIILAVVIALVLKAKGGGGEGGVEG